MTPVDERRERELERIAAERQRRYRARADLRALGYRLLRDVPVHPRTLELLLAAGLITAHEAADDRRLALAVGKALTRLAEIAALMAEPLGEQDEPRNVLHPPCETGIERLEEDC